jgi:hypothetical protein
MDIDQAERLGVDQLEAYQAEIVRLDRELVQAVLGIA